MPDETITTAFEEFVLEHERRLRNALTASLGIDAGREAAADALAHAWENWDRVRDMDNPGAYLYVVGRNRGRRSLGRKDPAFPTPEPESDTWVEPGLPAALARLTEPQRTVVMLIDGYDWTLAEVAEFLGVSKSTVQTHHDRGLDKLRRRLGVGTP